ncbi:MAG TPA: hypothetical protein VLI90_17295 [Tepidisphaeraceae bacterium]|nr:hypothetical protein [Tepidisphaeraceae bacterium]
MLTRFAVAMMTVAAGIGGCATQATPAAVAPVAIAPAPAAKPAAPVIVRLVSRHYTIVVSAGRTAPLYQVTDNSGKLLADGVTLAQLRLVDNNLYQELVPALAPKAEADASMEGPAIGLAEK